MTRLERLADAPPFTAVTLWNQVILAAALAGVVRRQLDLQGDRPATLAYLDTHAGPGRLAPAPSLEQAVPAAGLGGSAYAEAAAETPAAAWHAGSWLLAGRVLARLARPDDEVELDVNDLSEAVIEQARANREAGRVRFWSHDWFLFLRHRLNMGSPPSFVFIDPPPDDPRGPAYAVDAAILLDTLGIPYMVSYPANDPQPCLDQVGRTGLELHAAGGNAGVMLGGGAERALLHLIADLRPLAEALGGDLVIRLPRHEDYCI